MNITSCFLPLENRTQLNALMERIEIGSHAGLSAPSAIGLGPGIDESRVDVLAMYCATAQFDRAESLLAWMKSNGRSSLANTDTVMKLFALASHGLSTILQFDDGPTQRAINFVFELSRAAFPPAASSAQTTEARQRG